MKSKDGLIIGLLGIVAGLLLVLIFQVQSSPDAVGQTAAAKEGKILLATGTSGGGSGCSCWIYDTESQKLAVYILKGTQLSGLAGVRLCSYDFNLNEYPRQRPSIEDVKKIKSR